ncbi:MAG: pyrimidine/purine nucleoside phosphorylase [Pseudomonadales bacterium]
MSTLDKVSVALTSKAYFDGQVTSRNITFADGEIKTLGLMLPGEYEFGTAAPELMQILSGEVEVRLAGENSWTSYTGGQEFNVVGDSKFAIKVKQVTDYLCTYG